MAFIVPAVLPSSRADLEEKLALLTRIPGVSRIQIDVVDGRFAEPASWPFTAPKELRAMMERGEMLPHLERIVYEIDLMCADADRAAAPWLALGATRLIFHAESVTDLGKLLASAHRRYGAGGLVSGLISFGVALNIASELALIEPYIGKIEYVQFMGIARIGRQGQPLDRRVFEKVRTFRRRHPNVPVQIDGGVSLDSAKEFAALGVSSLAVGSALLCASDPAATFAALEILKSPYEP